MADSIDDAPDPDVTLEAVFETTDPAVLPLATMALDEQGIEYSVEGEGSLDALRYSPGVPDLGRTDATHRIVVRREDAARARDLVKDLAGSSTGGDAPGPVNVQEPPAPVVDLETGQPVGSLTPAQAQFLIDALEEESSDEARYYIDAPTIEMLENAGADPNLISLLRRALGGRDGMEIRF